MMFPSVYVFCIIMVFIIHVVQNCKGLSIDLIHRFSSESPFHEPNITSYEMIKRFNPQPRTYEKLLSQMNFSDDFSPNIKVSQPKLVHANGGGYFAKLNLGTFPNEQPSYKTYYFHFDTGSYLTWLQCEDCTKPGGKCFHQNGSPYPNRRSTTYAPLPCDRHQLCFLNQCQGQYCSYNVNYVDSTMSFGILAYEMFTSDLTHTHQAHTDTIVIGCGIRNDMKLLSDYTNEAGILGMGWSPHSLVNQIFTSSQGRFSYCLPPVVFDGFGGHPTVLRFGNDIPFFHGLRSVSIRQYKQQFYGVNLHGISISTKRLNIPTECFAMINSIHGGCIFDTGTTYSFIPQKAFRILKEEMIGYVTGVDKRLSVSEGKFGFSLCFVRNPPFTGYNHLPTITFHFDGGVNLVQQPDIAFVVWSKTDRKYYCMGIQPSVHDNTAIIGSQSQANHVFVYDQMSKRVYFGPRDCTRNP